MMAASDESDRSLVRDICEALKSGDHGTKLSTCRLIDTVVVHDFPARVYLHCRDFVACLLNLCEDESEEISDAAVSCVVSVCREVVAEHDAKELTYWRSMKELMALAESSRDSGDGIDDSLLVLLTLASTIARKCSSMLLKSSTHFANTCCLLTAASSILRVSFSPPECGEFLNILAETTTSLSKSGEKQYYVTVILLLAECTSCYSSESILNPDTVKAMYDCLSDTTVTHFHPEVTTAFLPVIKHSGNLHSNYETAQELYKRFRNLAKLVTTSTSVDLTPLLDLLQLEEALADSVMPFIVKHIQSFGGGATIFNDLLTSRGSFVKHLAYSSLTILASPIRSPTIGATIMELLLDETITNTVLRDLAISNDKISCLADKYLTLVLKSRCWIPVGLRPILVDRIAPRIVQGTEMHLHKLPLLRAYVWEILQDSCSTRKESAPLFGLNFTLSFLIRNGAASKEDPDVADRCCELVVAILLRQDRLLRPPLSLLSAEVVKGVLATPAGPFVANSTADFQVELLEQQLELLRTADVVEARSCLMEISILLEDYKVHAAFLGGAGCDLLRRLVVRSLQQEEPCLASLANIVTCFAHLVYYSEQVRRDLADDSAILMNLMRVWILNRNDVLACRRCSSLLQQLTKNTDSGGTSPADPTAEDESNQPPLSALVKLWNSGCVQSSAKFILNASASTLAGGSLPAELKMSASDLRTAKAANDLVLAAETLALISECGSHAQLGRVLRDLQQILLRRGISRRILTLDWRTPLATFFRLLPQTPHDEAILTLVLRTVTMACELYDDSAGADPPPPAPKCGLIPWLTDIVQKESNVFWVLFSDVAGARRSSELWSAIVNFVGRVAQILFRSSSGGGGGSLNHVLDRLRCSIEAEDSAPTYDLNSLKSLLDCARHVTAAMLRRLPVAASVTSSGTIPALLEHVTRTVVSFPPESSSNKGRSIVRSCSQVICQLLALLHPHSAVRIVTHDWLLRLLRHPDPGVKLAALHSYTLIITAEGAPPESTIELTEAIADLVLDPEQAVCVIRNACIALGQTPHRISKPVLAAICAYVADERLHRRIQDLANGGIMTPLCRLLANILASSAASAGSDDWSLDMIANNALPHLVAMLDRRGRNAGVDSAGVVAGAGAVSDVVARVCLLHSSVAEWFAKQVPSVQALCRMMDSAPGSDDSATAGSCCFLLSIVLSYSGGSAALMQSPPWHLLRRIPEWSCADTESANRILLFFKMLLVRSIIPAGGEGAPAATVTSFVDWLAEDFTFDAPARRNGLRVLELLVAAAGSVTPHAEARISGDLILRQLKSWRRIAADEDLCSILRLANNLLAAGVGRRRLLPELPAILAELLKLRPALAKEVLLVERALIVSAAAGAESNPDLRSLFKMTLRMLHPPSSPAPESRNEEDLLTLGHRVLVAATRSPELRCLLAKCRPVWGGCGRLAESWRSSVRKKRCGTRPEPNPSARQQLMLLSRMTEHQEPILPLDPELVETVAEIGLSCDGDALDVMRNMAFLSHHQNAILSNKGLEFFCAVLTDAGALTPPTPEKGFRRRMAAVAALLALAPNNHRVKMQLKVLLPQGAVRGVAADSDPARAQLLGRLCRQLDALVDAGL